MVSCVEEKSTGKSSCCCVSDKIMTKDTDSVEFQVCQSA